MDTSDVVIVGGGPAGSSCAWRLRAHGISSVILESQEFPRTKLCAGWITPKVIDDLEINLSDYPHGIIKLDKISVEYCGRRRRHRWILPTRQFSIRRFEFDWWLLQRCGAAVRTHRVRQIRSEPDGYVIDGEFKCRSLVGAGGTLCPVYRSFFSELNRRGHPSQVCTLEEEFPFSGRDAICRLWFCEGGLPGYSWYVPKADGWVNIGIGALASPLRLSGLSLRIQWNRFITKLMDLGLIDRQNRDPGGYTYYVRSSATVGQHGNCYIVGDAAGLATSDLAEGIGPAIESGIRAADSIANGTPYSLRGISHHSWPGFVKGIFRSLWHS